MHRLAASSSQYDSLGKFNATISIRSLDMRPSTLVMKTGLWATLFIRSVEQHKTDGFKPVVIRCLSRLRNVQTRLSTAAVDQLRWVTVS